MKSEIDLANSKVIALQAHLGSPPSPGQEPSSEQPVTAPKNSGTYSYQDELIDLQQLATSSRSIYARAQNLRWLIIPAVPDPFPDKQNYINIRKALEFNRMESDSQNFIHIVDTYQEVRAYAQSLRDGVSFWYGGIASSILPIFYALLGASAWSLRRIQIGLRD